MHDDQDAAAHSPSCEPRAGADPWRSEWFAPLPEATQQAFDFAAGSLDTPYSMMSVALDEAFRLRAAGQLIRARAQTGVAAALSARLAARLDETLSALVELGRRSGRNAQGLRVAPLEASSFRHPAARERLRGQALLHLLLLKGGLRFQWKVRRLKCAAGATARAFQEAALDISEGTCVRPRECWDEMEMLHDDLNTCVRETIVQMKYFLRALPAAELALLVRHLGPSQEATVKPFPPAKAVPLDRRSLRASA